MRAKLNLSSFRLLNFKAIQDSKTVKFTPLTAFIGNNGSGKSSIIEALETFQTLALHGIDAAMQPWHGFEYIWNRAVLHKKHNPMTFNIQGLSSGEPFRTRLEIAASENLNKVFFQKYSYHTDGKFTDGSKHINNGEITDKKLKAFVETGSS